jgi:hypothetical protein
VEAETLRSAAVSVFTGVVTSIKFRLLPCYLNSNSFPIPILNSSLTLFECVRWGVAGKQNISFFKLRICSPRTTHEDTQQDNPVNTVTRLRCKRPRNRGSIPCNNKKFFFTRKCPDLLWSPQNLLFNGYPERLRKQKIGRGVQLTTHFKSTDIDCEYCR